jgi:alkylation response protein AidB-like acyl-CoA dehydrogenase
MKTTFERVAERPLRWLTELGGSEVVDRLGLRAATERALHGAGASIGKVMSRAKPRRKPQAPPVPPPRADGEPARLAPVSGPPQFDLTPTDDQALIVATARRFADEVLRPAASEAEDALAPPRNVVDAAHALGFAALVIPEAVGGVAETRAAVTAALIAEELARGDMGLALAALAPVGVASAVVDWGTRAQQDRWLPAFGERFVPAALAVLEPRPGADPARPQTGAIRTPGGWKLHGDKSLVPLAETAELLLVLADIRGAGPRLFAIPRGTPGVTISPQPAMGLRAAALARVTLDGAFVPDDALLGGDNPFDAATVVDRGRILWGAMAVGGVRAVLEYAVPYVNERMAFGEPVSHRQAVAFLVADLAIELEGMRLLVHRAASLADRGRPVTREARLVRVQCAAKAMKAGTDGVQLLGGHGFVKDHPMERWYRDLRAIGVMEGALS